MTEGDSADVSWSNAVPAAVGPEDPPAPVLFTVEVDGETFAVREDSMGVVSEHGRGFSYEWLTGPNQGYGFGVWGPPPESDDFHVENVRSFLRNIDPATGYLRED